MFIHGPGQKTKQTEPTDLSDQREQQRVSLTSSNPAQDCFYADHSSLRNLSSFTLGVITYRVDAPHTSFCIKSSNGAFL